jgi:hypothetical protein
MLTRSQSKQSITLATSVKRSTRTRYYLRNLPIINYFEPDDEDLDDDDESDDNDEDDLEDTEIDFSYYHYDNMPGPYDDIGSYYGSGYCDYCGYGSYHGYDGYDN